MILRAMERFLLPNACICCRGAVPAASPDSLVCAICTSRFRTVRGGCGRCHHPDPPVGPCRFCAEWHAGLGRVDSAVWLDEEARAVVHHLKYEHCPSLAAVASAAITARLPSPPDGVLIPIPSGRARLRRRGYNQAALLAEALRRAWGLPLAADLLRRRDQTESQTALTPEARVANVAGAFAAVPNTSGRAVILVDDVLTTGATVSAAAAALAGAGAHPIRAVTFARALPYELKTRASA